MPARFFVDHLLHADALLDLPPGAARHVQVLRLQPGVAITLFNGADGEWAARIERIGRSSVAVRIEAHSPVDRELPLAVTLALGMPANDRMDTVVEKATELGVAVLQPLHCERSVLRLNGERAQKKVAHWQAVAVAACEQSGRTRVPRVEPVRSLAEWLGGLDGRDGFDGVGSVGVPGAKPREQRWVLSLRDAAASAAAGAGTAATQPGLRATAVLCLSGPEGGLAPSEEDAAVAAGFSPLSLGPRVLRADTAPLALLAHIAHISDIARTAHTAHAAHAPHLAQS